MRSWLFLALARSGWGEAILGLRVARRLVARGDRVTFLAHPGMARIFVGEPVGLELLGEEEGDAVEARVAGLLRALRPRALVLADLLLVVTELVRRRAPRALARTGVPIVGVDTWHLPELGGELDLHPSERLTLAAHLVGHPRRLVPVPFVRPGVPGAALILPDGAPASRAERASARAELGLPQGPLVLMATAGWQHKIYGDEPTRRLPAALPRLLAPAIEGLDVVHVGPQPLALPGARLHHAPQLPAATFERLIGAADLLLATNASATTNTTAVVRGVPVVTVVHSGPPDPDLPWAFQAWPIGLSRAMGTLLRDNPWDAALHRRELRDPEGLRATIAALLPGGADREGALATAAAVLEGLRRVPLPERVLDELVG